MVVDDDPMFRDLLTYGLEQNGYRVVTAVNGADAASILEKNRPDIILLDMMMPVMDGIRFLEWLGEKAKLEIPTVLLTCIDDRALVVKALVAGAADVVLKPVGLDVLLEKLGSILSGEKREQAREAEEEKGDLQPDLLPEP